MHVQVLSSGSEGNSLLIRAGETTALVDAGLGGQEMRARMTRAGLAPRAVDHVVLTHGHLDHSRSSGVIARREWATLHCSERYMIHPSVRRARQLSAITIGEPFEVEGKRGPDDVVFLPVLLPHDCDPTVAYRIQHGERVCVVLTDMGRPSEDVARALRGAHVLVLEFNYDEDMMASGPYPEPLRRRITGDRGHLSNEQAVEMLERLAGPELHTLILAHISKKTNTPELALTAARGALERLGLGHVEVLVASQAEVGPNLAV